MEAEHECAIGYVTECAICTWMQSNTVYTPRIAIVESRVEFAVAIVAFAATMKHFIVEHKAAIDDIEWSVLLI